MSSITIQKMGISDLDTDAIVNAANKEIGRCDTGSVTKQARELQRFCQNGSMRYGQSGF